MFVYLIIVFDFFVHFYALILYISRMLLYIGYGLMPHASPALIFEKHTYTSRLGRGLAICHMTIGQGLDMWNTQFISECVLSNGRHTCLNHSSKYLHTVITKIVTGQIWNSFREQVVNLSHISLRRIKTSP